MPNLLPLFPYSIPGKYFAQLPGDSGGLVSGGAAGFCSWLSSAPVATPLWLHITRDSRPRHRAGAVFRRSRCGSRALPDATVGAGDTALPAGYEAVRRALRKTIAIKAAALKIAPPMKVKVAPKRSHRSPASALASSMARPLARLKKP